MNFEEIRERIACGDDRSIVEFLALQMMTNPQQDMSSMLPFLLLAGCGGRPLRKDRTLLVAAAFMAMQQQQSQATAVSTGVAPAPNNMMPVLAALLLSDIDRPEREFVVRPIRKARRVGARDDDDDEQRDDTQSETKADE